MRIWIRRVLGLIVALEGMYALGLTVLFSLLGPADPETPQPGRWMSVLALAGFLFAIALVLAGVAMTVAAGRRFDEQVALVVIGLQALAGVIGLVTLTPLLLVPAIGVGVVIAATLWLPDRHAKHPVPV